MKLTKSQRAILKILARLKKGATAASLSEKIHGTTMHAGPITRSLLVLFNAKAVTYNSAGDRCIITDVGRAMLKAG